MHGMRLLAAAAPTLPRRPIRAVSIDVDGTLFSSDGKVSAKTAAALKAAASAGVLPIICTGKISGPWAEPILALELGAPMVFMQGSLVLGLPAALVDQPPSVLLQKTLSAEACSAAVAFTDRLEAAHGLEQACCLACIGGEYVASGPSSMAVEVPEGLLAHGEPHPKHGGSAGAGSLAAYLQGRGGGGGGGGIPVNKLVILLSSALPGLATVQRELEAAVGGLAEVVSYVHTQNILEVTPKGVSKGAALAELLPTLGGDGGIQLDELMAIGDGSNDLSMLHVAGLAVAMGNGSRDVKEAADVVVGTNDEDGVAEAIERFVLGPPRVTCHEDISVEQRRWEVARASATTAPFS